MHRWPRALAVPLLASILLGATQAASPVRAGPGAPVIAEGVLRDGQGHPASGSLMLNLIDPDPTAGAAPLLAMGQAGPGGRFRLRLDASAELRAAAASNGGYLNLRLLAVTDRTKGVAMISRTWDGGRWRGNLPNLEISLTADAPLSDEQGAQLPRLRASAAAAEGRTARGQPSIQASEGALVGAAAIGSDNPYCYRINDEFRTAYTVIGELHTWRDMTATFGYGTSADSDISAGFSFDGGSTWTLAGQLHVGNATSTRSTKTVSSDHYGRTIRSQFEYVKYHYAGWFCYDDAVYQAPWRWTGGGIIAGSSQTRFDGKCGSTYPKVYLYGRNTSWSRSSSDFTNWSLAASVFGAGLKAQTGASRSADITYTFGSASPYHRICGSDDYPARATRVFAGP
jgi:hypothetical protein